MTDPKAFLTKLRNNLNILQEREAKYGGNAPLELLNQIGDHKIAITLTKQAITREIAEDEWQEALKSLNIDHTLIEGGFFQRIFRAISLPSYQQRELRNREAMLKLVRDFWVKGVLEQSLYNEALIELGLEERQEAVDNRPRDMVLQTPQQPDRVLPPGTRVMDVFNEMGQALLILGEPGSGKTTMLLELARDTIALAEKDPAQPIPVIFNLSSWGGQKATCGRVAGGGTEIQIQYPQEGGSILGGER
ncbi:MAG TPA: ATP-binding protein [Chloroflexi bacterium]|nr:MAG: hypothetical protein B6243_12065 [Anaerolineaceae bacterium 4572_5.2]HEY86324.1 ATP-binding protein [Chloroflexota bacterium]